VRADGHRCAIGLITAARRSQQSSWPPCQRSRLTRAENGVPPTETPNYRVRWVRTPSRRGVAGWASASLPECTARPSDGFAAQPSNENIASIASFVHQLVVKEGAGRLAPVGVAESWEPALAPASQTAF